ncbi:LpxL/LpxP family Kdo(2)-lipid IV(A) lauroyl/palmitoleoyl acyltransferase [Marinobacter lutaoensis]|uniref:LpxL/LpxP family Kdo(2)-lipid IV(A) lauroyl/palmitoleoyl acyltransferase n=1 Tax=Marinobacter lutaoensis TaxID=135739 RepID=UPI001593A626|nr:LpxL/LpxP family Kdo(2)-lipid IV(A) lauroyl/palmitoleoyl acyltransferase [Marinobacter lutaoensis]NVD35558.1 LpxL/LpxP family Kdo(2)-lipid IV(A) lauroyl/palmitoleoyl acyltransferase [Marinobacter lutaoensis]
MKKKHRKLPRNTDYAAYRHPRWWPTWALIGLMWLGAQLPIRWQWPLGRAAGWLAWKFAHERRRTTEINIRLCFPERSEREQAALVRRSFLANGIGLMELGIAWFRDPAKLTGITRVHGIEHYRQALAEGKGVLLLGAHYSTLDLGGSLVTEYIEADVMQRDHNNPLMNAVMTRARERRYGTVLGARDLRGLFRCLRQGRTVWYATDQDYGRKDIVFAPFFGIPAGTITATSRIAERSGCRVVPFSHFRHPDRPGYDIYFHPALENFPSGDDLADATRINRIIEQEIRKAPDQYLWMHRRFKTRPNRNDPGFYGRKAKKRRRR